MYKFDVNPCLLPCVAYTVLFLVSSTKLALNRKPKCELPYLSMKFVTLEGDPKVVV